MSNIVIVLAYTAYPDSDYVFIQTGTIKDATSTEQVEATYLKMVDDIRAGFPKMVLKNSRIVQL